MSPNNDPQNPNPQESGRLVGGVPRVLTVVDFNGCISDIPGTKRTMGPLSTTDSGFRAFLDRISADPAQYRMAARNFLLDEGIAPARCDSYRDSGAAVDHADRPAWCAQHGKYLKQRVFRPRTPAYQRRLMRQTRICALRLSAWSRRDRPLLPATKRCTSFVLKNSPSSPV